MLRRLVKSKTLTIILLLLYTLVLLFQSAFALPGGVAVSASLGEPAVGGETFLYGFLGGLSVASTAVEPSFALKWMLRQACECGICMGVVFASICMACALYSYHTYQKDQKYISYQIHQNEYRIPSGLLAPPVFLR